MLRKKIIAAAAALAVAASVAGCANASKILTVDGKDLKAGVYINYMLSQYSMLKYYSQYFSSGDSTTAFLDQKYSEDETYGEYLKSYALEQTLRGVAADKLFKEEGLELTDEEKSEIDSNVDSYVDSMGDDYLEMQGVSKESVKIMYTYEKEKELLFDHYYAKDGTKEVKDDEIKTYLGDNYLRYKTVTISKTPEANADGSEATDEQKKEADEKAKALADKYLALAKEKGADSFDEVIEAYSEETATTEATTEATSDEATGESTTSAETTATAATTEKATTEETTYDSSKTYTVTFYNGSSAAYDEDSDFPPIEVKGGDKVSKPDKTPEKPYYNFKGWYADANGSTEFDFDTPISADTVIYADFTTNETLTQYDSDSATDLQKAIKKMDANAIEIQSDDNNYYVVLKLDASAREDYLTGGDNHDSIISTMKTDEFNDTLDKEAKGAKIDKNDRAIKKYTPEKIEEIATKYSQSN